MAKNVRIQPETYAKLRHLAKRAGTSISDVAAEAIDELYRKHLIEEFNQGYARLRADPKAWKEEMEERKLWDLTLSDGLEDF